MFSNILIIAGEASGDLHGSNLVRELLRLNPDINIWGIGGEKMRKEGMETEYDISQMNFLGFSEVIKHLPFIKQVFSRIKNLIREKKPKLIILIDYPGFNLRIAKFAHQLGIKVLYYISPQVWAWGKNRVIKIAKYVNLMAVIFDFEQDFYESHHIPVKFVGHPLLESLNIPLTKEEFFKQNKINPEYPVLALLAGSRVQEVNRLLPGMINVAKIIKDKIPNCQILVSRAEHVSVDLYHKIIGNLKCGLISDTYSLMAHATVMMVASGTATLESAMIGTPFIMVYKLSHFSYWLGKKLIKVDHVAMANIVAGRSVVPEFIQNDFTQQKVVPVLLNLFEDSSKCDAMKSGFQEIRQKLGKPGASKRVAELALSMVAENG